MGVYGEEDNISLLCVDMRFSRLDRKLKTDELSWLTGESEIA